MVEFLSRSTLVIIILLQPKPVSLVDIILFPLSPATVSETSRYFPFVYFQYYVQAAWKNSLGTFVPETAALFIPFYEALNIKHCIVMKKVRRHQSLVNWWQYIRTYRKSHLAVKNCLSMSTRTSFPSRLYWKYVSILLLWESWICSRSKWLE